MENGKLTIEVGKNGQFNRILINGSDIHLKQDFAYYKGAVGDNSDFVKRASGAYIFRPKDNVAVPIGDPQSAKFIKGPLVQEVHQKYNNWISQVVRLYEAQEYLEMEWIVGPLPQFNKNMPGTEVISRYTSDIPSGDMFSTDSNGRFMISRKRNYRPTWNLSLTEPISANYYPVVSRMSIEDSNSIDTDKQTLFVMTDRAEGGSSLDNGELELMLHRRLFNDDAFGVGEALNETAYGEGLVVRGKHKLLLCTTDCETKSRMIAEKQLMKPVLFFGQYCSNLKESSSSIELPAGIKLLTMERWSEDVILIRLENLNTSGGSISVDLRSLFPKKQISSVFESTLDASRSRSKLTRLDWTNDNVRQYQSKSVSNDNPIISLKAKELKAFLVAHK